MQKRRGQAKLASSHLFTVRVWREGVGREWRGQVEQVMNGKVGYFREWAALVKFLEEALAGVEEGQSEDVFNSKDDLP